MTQGEKDIQSVVDVARKHNVGRLYLVGSALNPNQTPRDYDFAVEDLPAGSFFRFYGEVMSVVSKPVDLIDLSGPKTKFKDIIRAEGKVIYERKAA
jgi:hypothetical protein